MENLSSPRKPTIPGAGSKVLGSPGIVKLQKMAEFSKAKKPEAERMYQLCMEVLAEADQALERQNAIMEEERSRYWQIPSQGYWRTPSQEQYWESVVQMSLPIDQRKAQENKSLDGKRELGKQLPQMKQALDASRTTNQHRVAWDDTWALLRRAQHNLITTAHEIGEMLELLQVQRNASSTS